MINNTGAASFPVDLVTLKGTGGTISLVGFLDQTKANWLSDTIPGLIAISARIQ